MKLQSLLLVALLLAAPRARAGEVRTWTDVTDRYTIEATLIAFDKDQVVIERASDGELGVVDLDKLSKTDHQYLQSKEAVQTASDLDDSVQKWTLQSGLQVNGRLVDFCRKEVVLKRTRGKVYVNGRVLGNLPPIYQRMVPKIVAQAGNQVTNEKTLTTWLASRKGLPQTFVVDGVRLELENGDEYGVPFFMFSDDALAILKPGWNHWLASNDDGGAQQEQAFVLQTAAARYQQDRQDRRQIAQMQLSMQAIQAGVTSMWEVTLYPARGNNAPPLWIPSMGRSSREATQNALARNPGYVAGPVRRVSN